VVWFKPVEIFQTAQMQYYPEHRMMGVEVGDFSSLRNHKYAEGMSMK
jgi:hypothetical protein